MQEENDRKYSVGSERDALRRQILSSLREEWMSLQHPADPVLRTPSFLRWFVLLCAGAAAIVLGWILFLAGMPMAVPGDGLMFSLGLLGIGAGPVAVLTAAYQMWRVAVLRSKDEERADLHRITRRGLRDCAIAAVGTLLAIGILFPWWLSLTGIDRFLEGLRRIAH